jgi:hypothetical protein
MPARHLATLEEERDGIRQRYPVTHVQREKPDSLPMTAILGRGQYDKPKDKVVAATPAVLHPFPAGAPTNRLGLAQWLISPENPLVARVTVNRFWQEIFGVGLVKSAEDFGIMGEPPANPELLDWLAVEFISNGWDVKQLFERIVTLLHLPPKRSHHTRETRKRPGQPSAQPRTPLPHGS